MSVIRKSAKHLSAAAPARAVAPGAEAAEPGLRMIAAEVETLGPAGPTVRLGGRRAVARVTAAGYRPSPGDRVLVVEDGGEVVLIAAVRAALPPALALSDGATAALEDGALALRGPDGALLVRYAEGCVAIAPPSGDLRLAAPAGRVIIEAGQDIVVRAARDLAHEAGRAMHLEAPAASLKAKRLAVEAREGRLTAGLATVLARRITTSAEAVTVRCVRHELEATKLVERTREAFRDTEDLAQTRVGRSRTVVKDVYSLFSRRAVMVSREETSVDGRKILIG